MWKCSICSSHNYREEHVNEVFNINERLLLVEGIPAQVCSNCGEKYYSRETTEKIRKMVHEGKKPAKSVKMDVFEFA